jgi:EpsI family protein
MTKKFLAAFLFIGLNAYVYWYMGSVEVTPARTDFSTFPQSLGDWTCYAPEDLPPEVINNLKVTDYVSCGFVSKQTNATAHLYIGYHERQTRDRESGKAAVIHPPEHCLPGSGWDVIDSSIVPIDVGSGGEAKRFVIAKGNQRALVYFWYHSRGHVIARNHHKILWMFLDRARYGRTDGSLIRFTIPVIHGDMDTAEESFREFSSAVTPLLSEYLPD